MSEFYLHFDFSTYKNVFIRHYILTKVCLNHCSGLAVPGSSLHGDQSTERGQGSHPLSQGDIWREVFPILGWDIYYLSIVTTSTNDFVNLVCHFPCFVLNKLSEKKPRTFPWLQNKRHAEPWKYLFYLNIPSWVFCGIVLVKTQEKKGYWHRQSARQQIQTWGFITMTVGE